MKKLVPLFLLFWLGLPALALAQYEKDVLDSATGDLVVTFLGHGSLMLEFNKQIIQIDPWSQVADYSFLPRADLILITHNHPDHLDKLALKKTRQPNTKVIINEELPGRCPRRTSHEERRGADGGRHRHQGAARLQSGQQAGKR